VKRWRTSLIQRQFGIASVQFLCAHGKSGPRVRAVASVRAERPGSLQALDVDEGFGNVSSEQKADSPASYPLRGVLLVAGNTRQRVGSS
jgi:hypothetical protein